MLQQQNLVCGIVSNLKIFISFVADEDLHKHKHTHKHTHKHAPCTHIHACTCCWIGLSLFNSLRVSGRSSCSESKGRTVGHTLLAASEYMDRLEGHTQTQTHTHTHTHTCSETRHKLG